MVDPDSSQYGATTFLRWTARIWSIVSLTVILGFIAGEGIHFTKKYEALGFLFFPVGISVGMVLAWWKERLGGSMMVASLLIFYVSTLRRLVNSRTAGDGSYLLFRDFSF